MSTTQSPNALRAYSRREFLKTSLVAATALSTSSLYRTVLAGTQTSFGSTDLYILSDGNLRLPLEFVLPQSTTDNTVADYLNDKGITQTHFEPACNLTLWRTPDRTVLFDVGAGPNFMPSAGKLLEDLDAQGIDPEDITDVVLSHAHPDHLWGLIDDFDELAFPNAEYYMNQVEWDYWWDENTVNSVPESMQGLAVGARNRMEYLHERIKLFKYGDELFSGIEAIDSHGHTPGHTSFALHEDSDSLIIVGDVLIHPLLSFAKADWPWGTDQDKEAAVQSRLKLLDRVAADKASIVGYHLPHPGLGTADRFDGGYRFLTA